jgi:hypothetical protein
VSEGLISKFNGNAAVYMRIASLAFQGIIVAGVFWVGATFERKADAQAYRIEQETKRVELLQAIAKNNEIMARIDERLKNVAERVKP